MEELRISVTTQARGKIEWNKDELLSMVEAITAQYAGLVYTDEQIAEAKKDRAKLNKALAAVEDERKRVKAAILEPYDEFDAELKPITTMIKNTISEIDSQVKEYEAQAKAEKKEALRAFFNENIGSLQDTVPFETAVFNEKMLNASTKMEQAQNQIIERIERIRNDIRAIEGLDSEFKTAVKECYFRTFDLGQALELNAQLYSRKKQDEERAKEEDARRQAAIDALKADLTPEPEKKEMQAEDVLEMTFTVYGTLSQLKALKAYMDSEKLEYK